MTFECTSCDWSLPVEMNPVAIDTRTGEVTRKDPQEVIEESDEDLPTCPECGSETEYVDGGDE